MSRSRPEPFEVFSEEEFFARGAAKEELAVDRFGLVAGTSPRASLGLRALCGIAIAGLSLALVLAVALDVIAPARGVRRKAALRAARMPGSGGEARYFDRVTHRPTRVRPRRRRGITKAVAGARRRVESASKDAAVRAATDRPEPSGARSSDFAEIRGASVGERSSGDAGLGDTRREVGSRPEFGFER